MSRQDPYAKYGGKVDPYGQYGGSTIAPAGQEERSRGASGSWKLTPEQLPAPLRLPLQAGRAALGGLEQIGQGVKNVLGMPIEIAKTAYGAFTADPQSLAPEEIPSYTTAGPGGLALHRLLVAPQTDQFKQAARAYKAPAMSPGLLGEFMQGVKAVGHGMAGALPMLGPFAAHLGETIGEGRPLEAAGEAMTMGLLPKVGREAKRYAQQRPVRLGRAAADPATGLPLTPEPPILIKHGLPTPEIPKGKIPKYEKPTEQIAEGLGLLDDVEGTVLKQAIAEVYPDLKYAQQNAPGVRGPVNTPAKLRATLDWSNDRIWNDILEPEIRQSGKMQNLANLSRDVQAQLPEHVQAFYGELVQNKLDPIQTVIDRYKNPGEAIPQVDPMMIHGLAKAIRTELDLAETPMKQAIQRQMPKGEILFELNKVLREKLYDHVEMTRKVDIRPAARKYGKTADIKGEAADLTTPRGFFETLFSSYTFPTTRAVAARIGETAGKQMLKNMKALNKGFSYEMTPAEKALVTRPARPKPQPRSSIERLDSGGAFTDWGLRRQFNIPPATSLRALEQQGVIRRTPNGLWEVQPPQKFGPTYDYGIEEGPLAPTPPPVGPHSPRHVGLGKYSSIEGSPKPPAMRITNEDLVPAPTPPPGGPTAIIRPYGGGPTPKGEAYWPERTPTGTPQAFGERALPQKPMPPAGSKTGEFTFFPGKTGKVTETTIDPATGKTTKVRRDYRDQQQLFSESMSAPPRWKPTERATSTLEDLQAMRAELVNYLQRGNPTAAMRKGYIADVRALQAEITRRKAAQKTTPAQLQ